MFQLYGTSPSYDLLLIHCYCSCCVYVCVYIRHDEVVPFFEEIEKKEEVASTVMDYSISQTTLEEVFLNVSCYKLYHSKKAEHPTSIQIIIML